MNNIKERLLNKTATLGVIGLGYVGLPLAVEKAKAGYKTIGFDVQESKVEMVNLSLIHIFHLMFEYLRFEISMFRSTCLLYTSRCV